MKTSEVLLLAAAGVGVLLLMNHSSAPPPVIVRTIAPAGSALTAAEIAAGATVASNLIDDLFGNSDT